MMDFSEMVKKQRAKNNGIVKSRYNIAHKHYHYQGDSKFKDQIINEVKNNGDLFEYCSNIHDFLINLPDDAYIREGNRYYLVPTQAEDFAYQFRLNDGTLITNVDEKTPLPINEVARAVVDSGYGFVVYRDADIEIDEDYYDSDDEILYYVYV